MAAARSSGVLDSRERTSAAAGEGAHWAGQDANAGRAEASGSGQGGAARYVSNDELMAVRLIDEANLLLMKARDLLNTAYGRAVMHAAVVCADPAVEEGLALHLRDREYTVGKITNAHECYGITLLGSEGQPFLLEEAIMLDSGAEINAIVRPLAVKMGLKLRPCMQAMAVFGGQTHVITQVAERVPWVFFRGRPHQITMLVDLHVMEGTDCYEVLMGNKLLMHPALHSVVQGFLSALCIFPELRRKQLEAVREAGQAAWGVMYEIPITTFVTKRPMQLTLVYPERGSPARSDFVGQAQTALLLSGDVEQNPGMAGFGGREPVTFFKTEKYWPPELMMEGVMTDLMLRKQRRGPVRAA